MEGRFNFCGENEKIGAQLGGAALFGGTINISINW